MSTDGIDPQEEKICAIQDWPVPKCVCVVRTFFGLASYYRILVQNFARIAEPFSTLTFFFVAWGAGGHRAPQLCTRRGYHSGFVLSQITRSLSTLASDVAFVAIWGRASDRHLLSRNYFPRRRELIVLVFNIFAITWLGSSCFVDRPLLA